MNLALTNEIVSGSLRGKPPVCHKFLVRGERISLTAFMSMAGVLDCHITHRTVIGNTFYHFVENFLLLHLMPFDGKNRQCCYSSIYHIDEVVDMIHEVGALERFLLLTHWVIIPSKVCFLR